MSTRYGTVEGGRVRDFREIIVCEKDFSAADELCTYLLDGLGFSEACGLAADARDAAGAPGMNDVCDVGGLAGLLERIDQPTRLVIRHDSFADPVKEAEGLKAIEDAAHGADKGLDWFDAACAALEEAAARIDLLDVIVYYDDLGEDELDGVPGDGPVSAARAIELLRQGNLDYLTARQDERNISGARIRELFEGGQQPYAVVITCSDSRVVPEHIFMAGLGEIFTIRVAGNVVGSSELASAVYACDHLSSKLLLVLGHTHGGAIEAAMSGEAHGPVAAITSRISEAIAQERDPYAASVLNVRAAIEDLAACPEIAHLVGEAGLEIHGAIYHTHSGVVDFLP